MNLRTPLAEARGLGSAKEGVGHWWHQRLTAIALVPLTLWLGFSVALLGTADYYRHGALGIQVVVEDYVATEWKKIALIVLVQFAAAVLALAGIFAVLRIALGV